jgi:methyltransferase (TIGR00027 family)
MAEQAAQTGTAPTTVIAVEQNLPPSQRIVTDPIAVQMLPFSDKIWVWLARIPLLCRGFIALSESSAPGAWAIFPCRKRYVDDKVNHALTSGVRCIVNLGAGFDTMITRNKGLADIPVFEVDQPVSVEEKRARLAKALGDLPENLTLVPMDLDHQEIGPVLTEHGVEQTTPTVYVLEGLTQYLTQEGIEGTFGFLSQAAPGSRLVFTYVKRDFLDGRDLDDNTSLYKRAVAKGMWKFGLEPDDVATFLDGYGWEVLEHLGYNDLRGQYLAPTGRDLKLLKLERLVYAEKR